MQPSKALISCLLNDKSLMIIQFGRILMFKPVRLNLNGKGINLSVPEPFRATELNVLRINCFYGFQVLQELLTQNTFLNTKGDIGDSVCYRINQMGYRQDLEILGIVLTFADKMPVAALQGKTIRQAVKAVDDPDHGRINHRFSEIGKAGLPLFPKVRVLD